MEKIKKKKVMELLHIYLDSLSCCEIKEQLFENLMFDCECDKQDSADYIVDLIERKFGESVESLHERTDGGRNMARREVNNEL